jgi:SAM-dependent methyltransferase
MQELQTGVTDFATSVEARLREHSRLLELGCGVGDDAAYFAQHGHDVLATDVSRPALDVAAQRFADMSNLEFRHIDMNDAFEIGGQSCDAVYARLSLHYFDHRTTVGLFSEIAWVLRRGGQLFFMCRSTDDPQHGRGVELEEHYFDIDGHIRHFFDEEYTRDLLDQTGFGKVEIEAATEKLYGEPSAWLAVSAVR